MKPFQIYLMASFILTTSLMASCQPANKEPVITKIDKSGLTQLLAKNAEVMLVDVRTANEVASGKIPGSINFDWLDKERFAASIEELDKSKPIVVYCMSGTRSGKAADHLASAGFLEVYDYSEGYVGWSSN